MIGTVIYLTIALIVIGIVLYLLNMIIDMIPMDARFKQIAKVLLLLVAVLIILAKVVLPLVDVAM